MALRTESYDRMSTRNRVVLGLRFAAPSQRRSFARRRSVHQAMGTGRTLAIATSQSLGNDQNTCSLGRGLGQADGSLDRCSSGFGAPQFPGSNSARGLPEFLPCVPYNGDRFFERFSLKPAGTAYLGCPPERSPVLRVKERRDHRIRWRSDILYFASFTMCATINLAMSALIFTGGLQEVLPRTLAVRGGPGGQCAVCESCKSLICKVLR